MLNCDCQAYSTKVDMLTQQMMFEGIVTTIYPEYKVCFDKGLITYLCDIGIYITVNDKGTPLPVNRVVVHVNDLLKCYIFAYNDGYVDGFKDSYNHVTWVDMETIPYDSR